MNVDKNIDKWVYCLIKYGDVYLRLYRESDYVDKLFNKSSIDKANGRTLNEDLNEDVNLVLHKASDPYSYYVEMVPDPSTMFELTKYGQTFGYIEVPNAPNEFDTSSFVGGTTGMMSNSGSALSSFNFKYRSTDVNVYQADDFVHAALEDNVSRFPETVDLFYDEEEDYTSKSKKKSGVPSSSGGTGTTYTVRRGKSMLYDSYKVWREKALLEAACLLSRLTRSGIIRMVAVEVGDMPKEQVQLTLRRVKEMFEQRTAYATGTSMSEYNNPGAVENFVYFATHNGQGAITVTPVGGDYDPKQLTDLEWWNSKYYSAFGIPKQYFGWTDDATGFNGGSSLSIISSVYCKGVKRIQNTIIQAVTDIINLILLNKGCKAYLNNFILKMQDPTSQEKKDYLENFTNRVNALSNVNSLFADVEDKARRLTIVKSLITTLSLGAEIASTIDEEIADAKEAAKKAKEQEAAEAAAAAAAEAAGGEGGELDLGGEEAGGEEPGPEDADVSSLDLAPMPDSELSAEESFTNNGGSTTLVEGPNLLEDDDLPTPEEVNGDIDFTENK